MFFSKLSPTVLCATDFQVRIQSILDHNLFVDLLLVRKEPYTSYHYAAHLMVGSARADTHLSMAKSSTMAGKKQFAF